MTESSAHHSGRSLETRGLNVRPAPAPAPDALAIVLTLGSFVNLCCVLPVLLLMALLVTSTGGVELSSDGSGVAASSIPNMLLSALAMLSLAAGALFQFAALLIAAGCNERFLFKLSCVNLFAILVIGALFTSAQASS